MGVLGMLTTTLNLIGEISGLGLHRSAVKEISLKITLHPHLLSSGFVSTLCASAPSPSWWE